MKILSRKCVSIIGENSYKRICKGANDQCDAGLGCGIVHGCKPRRKPGWVEAAFYFLLAGENVKPKRAADGGAFALALVRVDRKGREKRCLRHEGQGSGVMRRGQLQAR